MNAAIDLLKEDLRPVTVAEYHQMIDAGVFREDEHLELIHGLLVARSPQSGPHARIIQRLTGRFVRTLGEAYDVRVQLPLTLEDSEPEPDFSIVPQGEEGRGSDHPRTALLVIEVARTTLRRDRAVKVPLYARAGVPEFWIIDVNGRQIEVRRDLDPGAHAYRTELTVGPDDALAPAFLPNLQLFGRDLLA